MVFGGGGRSLTGGKSVNLVIHDEVGKVEIPAHRVDEVPEADAVSVPVATGNHHLQVVIGKLCARGHRHRPPVQAVHSVGVNEARKVRRAADARNQKEVLGLDGKL